MRFKQTHPKTCSGGQDRCSFKTPRSTTKLLIFSLGKLPEIYIFLETVVQATLFCFHYESL